MFSVGLAELFVCHYVLTRFLLFSFRATRPAVQMGENKQGPLLLWKQLAELSKHPVEGFSAGLIDDSDIFKWEVGCRVRTAFYMRELGKKPKPQGFF